MSFSHFSSTVKNILAQDCLSNMYVVFDTFLLMSPHDFVKYHIHDKINIINDIKIYSLIDDKFCLSISVQLLPRINM